jgi:hypothetical protein
MHALSRICVSSLAGLAAFAAAIASPMASYGEVQVVETTTAPVETEEGVPIPRPVEPLPSGDQLAVDSFSRIDQHIALPGVTYAIGDNGPSGGWVFYVMNDGLHGLEAAPHEPFSLAQRERRPRSRPGVRAG